MRSGLVASVVLVLVSGCARPSLVGIPPSAETISLLGDTLWSVPVPVPEGRWRVQRLNDARDQAARYPGQLQAALELARATIDLGRLREAIRVYDDAAALGPTDPRPFLGRGETYLRLREFDRAWADLRVADRVAAGRRIADLEPRPDGSVRVRSVSFGIPYFLGFLSLLRGDQAAARNLLAAAAAEAETAEDAARAAFWHAVASGGSGSASQAAQVIPARLRTNPPHPLLVLFDAHRSSNGTNGTATPCPPGRPRSEFDAIRCFVAGRSHRVSQRHEDAWQAFTHVSRLPDWSVEVVLAAEAELSRLDNVNAQ